MIIVMLLKLTWMMCKGLKCKRNMKLLMNVLNQHHQRHLLRPLRIIVVVVVLLAVQFIAAIIALKSSSPVALDLSASGIWRSQSSQCLNMLRHYLISFTPLLHHQVTMFIKGRLLHLRQLEVPHPTMCTVVRTIVPAT